MKVLHVNQWDTRGGGAKASLRIHKTMLKLGVESRLMVSGQTGVPREPQPMTSLIAGEPWLLLDRYARKLQSWLSIEDWFFFSTWRLLLHKHFREADAVHLYGLSGGYFAFSCLPAISWKKPLIWFMTDLWPFTGHCAYPGPCQKWLVGCGPCERHMEGPISQRKDRTALSWRFKKRILAKTHAILVAPSIWMRNQVLRSPIGQHFQVQHVPNGVEVDIFQPFERGVMRRLWGLPQDARIIMISTSTFSDPRKGAMIICELLQMIKSLCENLPLHILFVGRRHKPFEDALAAILPFTITGYIEDQRLMATLYNSADLLLHPSLDENLSNMTCDSLGCGIPVFCFDVGGMRDVIIDGVTGYAAVAGDCTTLAHKVADYIHGRIMTGDVRGSCRDLILKGFTTMQEVQKILKISESYMQSHNDVNHH